MALFKQFVQPIIPSQTIAAGAVGSGSGITQGDLTTTTTGISIGGGCLAQSLGLEPTLNIQSASGSQPGLLTAIDWTTFNTKLSSISGIGAGEIFQAVH